MTTRDALLRAILAQPEEDTPRLVYADYLEEEGEGERAEFIRSQVGRNTSAWVGSESPTRRHYRPWMLRELDALPFDGRCEWDAAYRRGLLDEIHLPTAAFLQHARAIFSEHPVTAVTLTDLDECVSATDSPPKVASDLAHSSVLLYPLLKSDEWATAGYGGQPYWRRWRNRARAERAWSDACVAYGRSREHGADLPPLLTPERAA